MAGVKAAVVGGGPAGLMAAEVLAQGGARVTVYEHMPSVGRKLLMAGRGGLNLTHAEPRERFRPRYREAADRLAPMLDAFDADALRAWAAGLQQETFVGTSGRVFPTALKASPLLRAWLARLAGSGVEVRTRMRWEGFDGAALAFSRDDGAAERVEADVTVLALGGASWPRLGSDGAWAAPLQAAGAPLAPFRPANGGVRIDWSEVFRERFAGEPLKGAAFTAAGRSVRGEAIITRAGLEGGPVYALGADLRDALDRDGSASLTLDLKPDVAVARLADRLARAAPGDSLSQRLRKAANLSPAAANLLREAGPPPRDASALAAAIKAVRLTVVGVEGLERAISTAGGVRFDGVDAGLMLRARPGVFIAGEMLDWEAPTGGYLLQACLATGRWAGEAALAWGR